MSNERIDLTQFDGIMEGPWELRTRPHGRNGMERRPEPNYNSTDVQKRLQAFTLTTTFAQQMSMCGYPHHSSIHFPASFDDADWLRVSLATARALAAAPDLIAELKRCYEREDMIIRALKDAWIGNTCWHQPSEHLEDIAETRGSTLGHIASLLQVDVNRQDIHDLEYGCGGENCEHNASE